jgi:tetratricopeptide (TPR) repeat protein
MSEADFLLTPEELLLRRRRRRRILIIALAVLLLLVTGVFAIKPARNTIRGFQARRHARQAFVFIDQQKWGQARDEATAAYQLRPDEPQAIRAVALLLSRAGQGDALTFWKDLASKTSLTREDLREEAGVALQANDAPAAEEAVRKLLGAPGGKPTPADLLLAAEVATRQREFDKVSKFAEQVLADPGTTRQDQLRATIALDGVLRNGGASLVGDPKQVGARLVEIAQGDDDVALQALVVLAQRVLSPPPGGKDSPPPLPAGELIARIDHHPLAKPSHKLLATEVEISQHPDQREQIEQRTIDRWKNGSNEELFALAAWLYGHGEYQRELDVLPLERATQTRELFLQHVDALGALDRWNVIRKILESERFPLDPVIEHMYLARCYGMQGQQQGADNNWQRALQEAAGDFNKLLTLGEYAEKNGVHQVAGTAYDAAAAVSPKSRTAQLGRLREVYAVGDTKRVHAILIELLKLWPNDTALQNDEAYARLLLLPPGTKPDSNELKSIKSLAEALVQQEPASLPHRTLLALALLKQNRPSDALALYTNLTVPPSAVSASAAAVHVAVLVASGQTADANQEFKLIPIDKLLPEERALIANL